MASHTSDVMHGGHNTYIPSLPKKRLTEELVGGIVVKNPPANAGNTGLISGPGRFHVPWSS